MSKSVCNICGKETTAQFYLKLKNCLDCSYESREKKIEMGMKAANIRDKGICQACFDITKKAEPSHCIERRVSFHGVVPWDTDFICMKCRRCHNSYGAAKEIQAKLDWLDQFFGTRVFAQRLRNVMRARRSHGSTRIQETV